MADSSNLNRSFLIVDLGASLSYTHHKQSIYAFASLLSIQNLSFDIWVPLGSKIAKLDLPMRKILLPGTHPVEFKFLRPKTWLAGILNRLYRYGLKKNSDFLLHIRVFVTANYLTALISRKVKVSTSIIFTTACPFTVKAVYLLESIGWSGSVFIRLTNTSETRGKLSKLYDFKDLIEDADKFQYTKVRFGIETENYLAKLSVQNNPKFYISKFPQVEISSKYNADTENFTISFLGYPTVDKGHDQIVTIIKEVSQYRPEFHWQVHLYENDPFEICLRGMNLNLTIVEGKIETTVMENLLSVTSLMCLPYDPKAFEFHASAMHYQAMDYQIPILCFNGTSFSNDVSKFNSGAVAKNTEHMINILKRLNRGQINEWSLGCQKYNKFRFKTNQLFLDLLENRSNQ